MTSLDKLLDDFDAAKPAALARAISIVENERNGADDLLARLHTRVGKARRIGMTGPPGAGKSTTTTQLATLYRAVGLRVGIVAVDPTSPFTGGALLGDRIRMESVALDPGIYIRSLATRGSLGGLSAATRAVADVLDAFGFDRIIIETVGVGQSELDVARAVDSNIVILVPESGDAIQTLKAGLMEIADLFVVNKSDRPGADRVKTDLELMLGMRSGETMKNVPAHHGVDLNVMNPARVAREAAAREQTESWVPPVIKTVASKGEGIADLVTALDRHWRYLETSGALRVRRRQRLREQVLQIAESRLRRRVWNDPQLVAYLDQTIGALENGDVSPFRVADAVLEQSAGIIQRGNE
jgi:LAO/AO transport system kinase